MQNFLIALIECSVTMSAVALAYIAVTPLLSGRYAAKWRYYAWMVIVIGLIIPFRPHLDTAFIRIDLPVPPSGIQQTFSVDARTDIDYGISSSTGRSRFSTIRLHHMAGGLWLAGGIMFILYHGLKHRRFIRMVKRWGTEAGGPQAQDIMHGIQADCGIAGQVQLRVCPFITTPMLTGVIAPMILLPAANFSAEELSFIIRHELIHFKRKDLVYKGLVLLATAVHWFNPVVYLAAREIAAQCEISCDAEVVKGADMDGRRRYGETIIGVIKNQAGIQTAFSTNFYGGKKSVKNRILSIMNTTKKKAGVHILCLVLIGTIGGGAAFAANNKAIDRQGAYSTDRPISAQEQAKVDRQYREEIAKQYAVYAGYGLSYDSEEDMFYYNGRPVRFFADQLDEKGTYNSFTRNGGVVDLRAVRNSKNELAGIVPVSQEEYDKRTDSIKSAQSVGKQGAAQENASEGDTSGPAGASETGGAANAAAGEPATAFSEGDPGYVDNSLNAYLSFGVSYDKAHKQWRFNDKPIHFLIDTGEDGMILQSFPELIDTHAMTYLDNRENAVKEGVSLKVVRNADGRIERLTEITKEEVQGLLK